MRALGRFPQEELISDVWCERILAGSQFRWSFQKSAGNNNMTERNYSRGISKRKVDNVSKNRPSGLQASIEHGLAKVRIVATARLLDGKRHRLGRTERKISRDQIRSGQVRNCGRLIRALHAQTIVFNSQVRVSLATKATAKSSVDITWRKQDAHSP